MQIPIFNSLYIGHIHKKFIKSKKIDLNILNSLNLQNVDVKKFPVIKILDKMSKKNSLFETVLVSINDELVNLFFKEKIKFLDISSKIWQLINLPIFQNLSVKNQKI